MTATDIIEALSEAAVEIDNLAGPGNIVSARLRKLMWQIEETLAEGEL